ncbi:MAG TPA: histidine kinase [Chitinophagaceae bacterium]|nr:histidine kinase [Chitinophagaceae bacterium]
MRKFNVRYWACQIFGWGGWGVINLFLLYLFARDMYFSPPEKRRIVLWVLFIEFFWAVVVTHLLRIFLKSINWIKFSINKVIGLFIICVFASGLLMYYADRTTGRISGFSLIAYEKKENLKLAIAKEKELNLEGTDYFKNAGKNVSDSIRTAVSNIKRSTGWFRDSSGNWQYAEQHEASFWWDFILTLLLISLWLLVYMMWHYLMRNRKNEIDKISLEKTVKELELNTIKSHINPHFIFNSLNSIRALVDENPQRARTAITELSNILRSSMQVEKMETVPLEKELNIVKDYLALEQMRFEERLKVEMEIEDDTLQQPVPPMMLQTLVENAIKHGISKKIKGGVVKIISRYTDHHFELIVQNTGTLEDGMVPEGFGIKSTRDRLQFLFQGKADFQIKKINGSEVQVRIIMPAIYS